MDKPLALKLAPKSLDEILSKCEAIVIAANHTEFVNSLTIKRLGNSNIKVIVDWKNCLDKDSFGWSKIIYTGIWR